MMKSMQLMSLVMAGCLVAGCDQAAETGMAAPPSSTESAAEQMHIPSDNLVTPVERIVKSDEQWKQELTAEQYYILREKGTERAFSHPMHNSKEPGQYACAGCGQVLFVSDAKFDSGCGWPSFFQPADGTVIEEQPDTSLGRVRTEVLCSKCGGHLGHVFNDAPHMPTGLRYCINGGALEHLPNDAAPSQ